MMTLEEFITLPFDKVFAKGILPNSSEGIYMTDYGQGNLLKWVAKKGRINDWAIYCFWNEMTFSFIETNGDKVHSKENIQKCIPCSEEVLKLYRN